MHRIKANVEIPEIDVKDIFNRKSVSIEGMHEKFNLTYFTGYVKNKNKRTLQMNIIGKKY